jgi:predicted nucleic acid-binding protein
LILVDASGVIGALFSGQHRHEECARALSSNEERILSPFVLAEIDYFIQEYSDVETELEFLDEVTAGAYELAPFGAEDIALARDVVAQYRSLGIGLADASIVVLAERYSTYDILTLDERHFRAMRPLTGRKSFRLVPADA